MACVRPASAFFLTIGSDCAHLPPAPAGWFHPCLRQPGVPLPLPSRAPRIRSRGDSLYYLKGVVSRQLQGGSGGLACLADVGANDCRADGGARASRCAVGSPKI